MNPQKQIYTLQWQGITITITHQSDYSNVYRQIYGMPLHHIGIKADQPLPFTSTGYKSLFLSNAELYYATSVVKLVQNWLDEAACDSKWRQYQNSKQQLSLF